MLICHIVRFLNVTKFITKMPKEECICERTIFRSKFKLENPAFPGLFLRSHFRVVG